MTVSGATTGESIALDPFGRIVIGRATNAKTDFCVVRINPSGTLDSTFTDGTSGSGRAIVSFVGGTTTEEGKSVMIQPDGRILVAGVSGSNFAVARLSGGGSRYYVTQDANWNVTTVTDASGKVIDRYQYDPYGAITTLNPDFSTNVDPSGNVYIAYYYKGLRFDGNSGRYNARNRDYDPTVGAWVSADPAGYVDGANPYQADDSSPETRVDPFGQAPDPDWTVDLSPTGSLRTQIAAAENWLANNPKPTSGRCPDQLWNARWQQYVDVLNLMQSLGTEFARRRDYHWDRMTPGPNHRATGDNMSDDEQNATYKYWRDQLTDANKEFARLGTQADNEGFRFKKACCPEAAATNVPPGSVPGPARKIRSSTR